MKILFYIWMILVIVMSTPVVLANDQKDGMVLSQWSDPVGDELSPGLTYPTHEHFTPYKGLFDLTEFSVIDQDAHYYRFHFKFVALPNPWRSPHGFSHPLIQIYIDNVKGGSTELFRRGAGVRLDPEAPWDVMLHITGWWVRLFRPEDRQKMQEMENQWNLQQNPFELMGAKVQKKDSAIEVQVPKKQVGQLENVRLFVFIGSFDSFGFDYYRDIDTNSDEWVFGGSNQPDLTPRVLDLLVPEGIDQTHLLTLPKDSTEYVTVPYIGIETKRSPGIGRKWQVWALTALVGLALLGIVATKSKKNPIHM